MERKQSKKEEGVTYRGFKEEGRSETRRWTPLRICAQRSENLKSEEGKSKEKAQQEVYIGGACDASQRRGGKSYEPSFNATLMPLRFTNRQTMMTARRTARSGTPFKSALIDVSTIRLCPLEFSAKCLTLWVPWFALKSRARIKGGLLYGLRKSQFYQAQGPGTIAPPKGQGLIPCANPFEEVDLKCPVCLLDLIHA